MQVPFPYRVLRNITGVENYNQRIKILAGYAPIASFAHSDINVDKNVRDVLFNRGRRGEFTSIHHKIYSTLCDRPQLFHLLNGGIVIIADDEIHQDSRNAGIMHLGNPSIINGAQTRGVIQEYLDAREAGDITTDHPLDDILACFQVIICDDAELANEITIARNSQNEVEFLSIMGAKGHFDELSRRMLAADPSYRIKQRETDGRDGEKYLDTGKLLQVITALTPAALIDNQDPPKPQPWHAYILNKCLTNFSSLYPDRPDDRTQPKSDLLTYYLDIAPQAWKLYQEWRSKEKWADIRILPTKDRKRQNGIDKVVARKGEEFPDGLIFPVLHGLSIFCKKSKSGWTVDIPDGFNSTEYLQKAQRVYKEEAGSNPSSMGINKRPYILMREAAKDLNVIADKDQMIRELQAQLKRARAKS